MGLIKRLSAVDYLLVILIVIVITASLFYPGNTLIFIADVVRSFLGVAIFARKLALRDEDLSEYFSLRNTYRYAVISLLLLQLWNGVEYFVVSQQRLDTIWQIILFLIVFAVDWVSILFITSMFAEWMFTKDKKTS